MRRNVILIDDDSLIRMTLKMAFENESFDFHTFSNLENAITYMSANGLAPELAIVDLRVSGQSGIDIGAALIKRIPELKVFLYTGDKSPEIEKRAQAAGFKQVLIKGNGPKNLAKKIQEALTPQN